MGKKLEKKLIEVTVTLKDKQMSLGKDGNEYWKITFDGKEFLNAEKTVKYFSEIDVDPSPRIKHDEVEKVNIKIIYG